jgi:two-component system chemotaxis response regulator CheB
VRVLSVFIVDDSPSVRAVLRRFLSRSPELRVIGEAADGEAAVEGVERLRPDVLLLDLAMPKLDGFGVLERLARSGPVPTVVLTSRANRAEVRSAFEALRAGAVELLPKPEDPESWRQLSETLPRVLQAAAAAAGRRVATATADGTRRRAASPAGVRAAAGAGPGASWRWLALGASTGGPAALRDLLAELPVPPPLRVVVVQHIARGFELGLADWLAGSLGLDVRVALDGEQPRPGTVRVAPAGAHLRVTADDRLALDAVTPPRRGHRPSVDELFLSLAAAAPRDTAAVLLTGMGTDGAEGLSALRRAGACCLAQDEASSAVFGMPRAAIELDAVELALPPRALGVELARRLEGRP